MGTCQSNEVYVKRPMTFDCNKPQRFSVALFKFHLWRNLKSLIEIFEVSCSQSFVFDHIRNLKFENL